MAQRHVDPEYVDVLGCGERDDAARRPPLVRLLACCVHEYMRVLYSKGVPEQVRKDLPRMECTVNGRRVATLAEFRRSVGLVNESYVHAMLPFATQTSMAVPVELLHEAFSKRDDDDVCGPIVSDARGPLSIEFVVQSDVWSVRVRKQMRVLCPCPERDTRPVALDVCVVYESLGASVLVYWAPAP